MNSPQAGIHVTHGADHIIIEKNYIYDPQRMGIKIGWGGASNILIFNNTIERPNDYGWEEMISVSGAKNVEVSYNTVSFNAKGEGIDLKDGTKNSSVHHNTIHDTQSVGIYIDAYATSGQENIDVYNNIVYNVRDYHAYALSAERGGTVSNVTFYNNIGYNSKMYGIMIPSHGFEAPEKGTLKNITVINNLFFNNGNSNDGGGIYIGGWPSFIEGIIIRNNIVSKNKIFQIGYDHKSNDITNMIIENNLIEGYQNNEHETKGINYIEGDPKIASPSANIFYLKSSSPAIDKGSSIAAPNEDFNGKTRPYGTGYDIGPFEYNPNELYYNIFK